ncbi:hypothetical protein PAAG_11068 [Paracoccidioides lutzii Pb01]|uniref:Uncharacterized protein n=1 Tax=Paracoccidioides lutzii (strain ATCC MYA-826 / Pb01) TaxID=502779 RepID=A0A0A2V725_PARBA|nr:hypothetical protein PAAG_11068 [Paracoccidioides lutzii Pb01]KGQ02117.1 hypothetical protein PAAG_11068 [Paracoccidioides lutzii Pb01]
MPKTPERHKPPKFPDVTSHENVALFCRDGKVLLRRPTVTKMSRMAMNERLNRASEVPGDLVMPQLNMQGACEISRPELKQLRC